MAIREIRKIPSENPIFFRGQLYQFFCFTLSLHWWYSIPNLVWFGQHLDPMKNIFFKILKISQFAKFSKFRMKSHFFPRQAIPTTFGFTLSLHWWYSIPSLVWFGQLLNPMKKNLFLKFLFREIQKVLYENPIFFLGKLNKKYFLLYTPITLVILHTPFVLIWKTPWPDAKEIFLKFSKTRISRNSQNSVWKTIFFLGKLYQQLFALHCHYIGDTQYRVWFDLDNSLRWRSTFLKFLFREIRKIPYENPIFFRGKLYQFYFALHCHYTGDTQYRVWFDLGNSLTRWKTSIFKILKNSHFAKFAKFRTKNHFFLGALYQNFFCFTLSLHWWYSIPRLVWFGQLLNPTKKKPFFKIPFSRNSQNFRTKTQFFFEASSTNFFLLYTLITLLILNTEFDLIWTTP